MSLKFLQKSLRTVRLPNFMGSIFDAFEGICHLFTAAGHVAIGMYEHPKTTLAVVAVTIGGIVGAVKYESWRTPSRANTVYRAAQGKPEGVNFDFGREKDHFEIRKGGTGQARVSEGDRLIMEYNRKKSFPLSLLGKGQVFESRVLIDLPPFGSVDKYRYELEHTKDGNCSFSLEDAAGKDETTLNRVTGVYRHLVKAACSAVD